MPEYVHEVRVVLAEGADPAALGGAVTSALCGHWEHAPPCRWPHLSETHEDGDTVVVRTTFTASADDETDVRGRIDDFLGRGMLAGPDGRVSRWQVQPA